MLLYRFCNPFPRPRTLQVIQMCYYARKPVQGQPSFAGHQRPNHLSQHRFRQTEVFEEKEDYFVGSMKERTVMKNVVEEYDKERRRLLFKILERKYFKQPQEYNVLTWNAKEQIRFLNKEYPEEWTVSRLAESFPVSEEGIRKILKAKYVLRTDEEIKHHDRAVKKRWLALKETRGIEGGPIQLKYEELERDGKLSLLTNSAGIETLPKPVKKEIPQKEPGMFEKIILDYVEKKEAAIKQDVTDTKISHLTEEERKLLQSFAVKNDRQTNSSLTKTRYHSHEHHQREKSTLSKTSNINYNVFKETSHSKSSESATLFDTFETKKQSGRLLRRPRRGIVRNKDRNEQAEVASYINKLEDSLDVFTEYQMKDTAVISKTSNRDENAEDQMTLVLESQQNTDRFDNKFQQAQEERKDSSDIKEFYANLQYDTDKGEYYIYDNQQYYHPFGQKDKTVKKIRVKNATKKQNVLYKKGEDFYSDDGEFLFRIP